MVSDPKADKASHPGFPGKPQQKNIRTHRQERSPLSHQRGGDEQNQGRVAYD